MREKLLHEEHGQKSFMRKADVGGAGNAVYSRDLSMEHTSSSQNMDRDLVLPVLTVSRK